MQGCDNQSSAADVPDDARNLDDTRDDNIVHDLQGETQRHPALERPSSCREQAMPVTVPSWLHSPEIVGRLREVSAVCSLYSLVIQPVAKEKTEKV